MRVGYGDALSVAVPEPDGETRALGEGLRVTEAVGGDGVRVADERLGLGGVALPLRVPEEGLSVTGDHEGEAEGEWVGLGGEGVGGVLVGGRVWLRERVAVGVGVAVRVKMGLAVGGEGVGGEGVGERLPETEREGLGGDGEDVPVAPSVALRVRPSVATCTAEARGQCAGHCVEGTTCLSHPHPQGTCGSTATNSGAQCLEHGGGLWARPGPLTL